MRADIRDVGDPRFVRGGDCELSIKPIRCYRQIVLGVRRYFEFPFLLAA